MTNPVFQRPTKPQPTSAPEYNPRWRFLAEDMNGDRFQVGHDSLVAAGAMYITAATYGYTAVSGVERFDTLPAAIQEVWNVNPVLKLS